MANNPLTDIIISSSALNLVSNEVKIDGTDLRLDGGHDRKTGGPGDSTDLRRALVHTWKDVLTINYGDQQNNSVGGDYSGGVVINGGLGNVCINSNALDVNATDIKLDGGSGRRNGGPAASTEYRRALVHTWKDVLTINYGDQQNNSVGGDYSGGVVINGGLGNVCINANAIGLEPPLSINTNAHRSALKVSDNKNHGGWNDTLELNPNSDYTGGVCINGPEVDIDTDCLYVGREMPSQKSVDLGDLYFWGLAVTTSTINCAVESLSVCNPNVVTFNSARKALTHTIQDELVINQDKQYSGGLKIEGNVEIPEGSLTMKGIDILSSIQDLTNQIKTLQNNITDLKQALIDANIKIPIHIRHK